MTGKQLYEQFTSDTGMGGRALIWEELPQMIRSAWDRIADRANGKPVDSTPVLFTE